MLHTSSLASVAEINIGDSGRLRINHCCVLTLISLTFILTKPAHPGAIQLNPLRSTVQIAILDAI